MKRFFRVALCCALPLIPLSLPALAATTLPEDVQQSLQKSKIAQSALSVAMLPLDAGLPQSLFNADVSVNPASTMKLITTFAALELLGPTYQWKTSFHADGPVEDGVLQGNLYLKGGGDPKLNMEKLWLLLRDLKANGIQRITGDLVLDRRYFEHPQLPAFNDDGDNDNKPYLVGPDSLLVNLKSVRVIARNDGGKTSVTLEPPLAGVRIDNRLASQGSAKCSSWPDVRYSPTKDLSGTTLVASGKLPIGCSAQSYLAMLDHPAYAAAVVRALWKELGGSIQGQDRQGAVPAGARVVAQATSPDLVEIIRDINKYSNNTMAQQLFLSIGARYRTASDGDDAKAAQRVIRQWLAGKGITATHLVMENGSGLSRAERVSVREMALILQAAYRSPYAAEYISSLPLVGMDGTMRKRLRNTEMPGQAHIKTGTLNNVRAVAGFSHDRNGRQWVIVGILNHPRPWGASSILDQLLIDLYRSPPGS